MTALISRLGVLTLEWVLCWGDVQASLLQLAHDMQISFSTFSLVIA
jgi:hypothetical protein